MIVVASKSPKKIAGTAFFSFTSSRQAIKAPVQAPVPGRGIPTKSTRPKNSYFQRY